MMQRIKAAVTWLLKPTRIVFLLACFMLLAVVNSYNKRLPKPEDSKEAAFRKKEQAKIEQNKKQAAHIQQLVKELRICGLQNDSLTKIAATKIDTESEQREKDITSRVIADNDLQRQMSDYYRQSTR